MTTNGIAMRIASASGCARARAHTLGARSFIYPLDSKHRPAALDNPSMCLPSTSARNSVEIQAHVDIVVVGGTDLMAWRRRGNGAVAIAQPMCNGGRLGRSQNALPLRGGFAKPR